jgi:mono/diheme cytochrome c family protein
MKNAILTTVLVASLSALACSTKTAAPVSTSTADRITALSKLAGNATTGKTVYETTSAPKCAGCHGTTGAGASGFPSITSSGMQSVEVLAGYILNGSPGGMPKQEALNDQQVADLIAYLKSPTFGK